MTIHRLVRPLVVAAIVLMAGCGQEEDASAQAVPRPAAPAVAAPAGALPAPRIVFFDRDQALRTSMAGRSMIAQAQQLQRNAQQQLRAEGQRLEADARAFQQQAAILAAGVRAQRQRDLQNRQAGLQRRAQALGGQIQAGFQKSLEQFSLAMQPVLQQIMRERGANLMLDRSNVLMSQSMDQFDITPMAVQRLDRTIQRIPVALANPPQAAAQRPGAPAAPRPAAPRPAAPRPAGQ